VTYTWAIRFYRRKRGLTVAEMAKRLGCAKSTIYRFEQGKIRQPRPARAALIKRLLHRANMPIGGLQ
jgi:excisionase family DNA binding protein